MNKTVLSIFGKKNLFLFLQRQNERLRTLVEEVTRAKESLQTHRTELGKLEEDLNRAQREVGDWFFFQLVSTHIFLVRF